jgi:hypothetical protein
MAAKEYMPWEAAFSVVLVKVNSDIKANMRSCYWN